jgi:conjugative transfer signal peptidase TraF
MRNKLFAWIIGGCMCACTAPLFVSPTPMRWNGTDSVPIGLYWTSKTDNSLPYAGICLEQSVLNPALRAGLTIQKGECASGYQPILKTIFNATETHPIAFGEDGFIVNGIEIPNTRAKPKSRTGQRLEHYPYGLYTAGLWAISGYNKNSFDSRYFGPISASDVMFYARPIWTINKEKR